MIFYVAFFANLILCNYVSSDYDPLPVLQISSQDDPPQKNVSITQYACPAESEKEINDLTSASNNKVKELPILPYCVFTRKMRDTNGNQTCQKEVKPIFVPSKNKEKKYINCGTSENQFIHKFGFYRCGSRQNLKEFHKGQVKKDPSHNYTGKRKIIPSYKVCYDISTNEAEWTRHTLMIPVVFDKLDLQTNEPIDQEINTDPFGIENAPFQHLKEIYESEQQTRSSKYKMLPQPLVPPEHFAFNVWKKTTNHIINMAPLRADLVPLMSTINMGLKEAQMRLYLWNPTTYSTLIIYTKVDTLTTIEESDIQMDSDSKNDTSIEPQKVYIKRNSFSGIGTQSESQGSDIKMDNVPTNESQGSDIRMDSVPTSETSSQLEESLFKPNIWIKFIYDEKTNEGLLIYIHNTPANKSLARKCADPVPCEFEKWSDKDSQKLDDSIIKNVRKHAYCCPANSELIEAIFSVEVEIQGTLDLNTTITKRISKRKRSITKIPTLETSHSMRRSKGMESEEKKTKTRHDSSKYK